MLNFLRKIRRSLIETGSTRKYLLYAVGEVLLVMIGILLALQVNNWNQQRKNRITEIELYHNLLNSLIADSTDLARVVEVTNMAVTTQELFLNNHFDDVINNYSVTDLEQEVSKTIAIAMSFIPRYGAYQEITNNGYLPLIESLKIKNMLVNLYDREYKLYQHIDATIEQMSEFTLGPVIKGKMKAIASISNYESVHHFNLNLFEEYYPDFLDVCHQIHPLSRTTNRYLKSAQSQVHELMAELRKNIYDH